MEDPLTVCRRLAGAAFDAWQEVAERGDRHETVSMGADGTATTRADRHLDEAVLAEAKGLGVSVLSEEAGFVGHGSGDLWAIVDPLDGSRNAGRGVPFFCTSIAVGRHSLGGVEAGVVRDLVLGTEYAAVRGGGATLDGRGVQPRPFDPDEVLVAVIADYADPDTVQRLQGRDHHMRDLGSAALELCLVGTGALDALDVRRDWLRIIDIAAGTLFVREAGGLVLRPGTLQDLDMDFDLSKRTGLLAAKDRQAVEVVR